DGNRARLLSVDFNDDDRFARGPAREEVPGGDGGCRWLADDDLPAADPRRDAVALGRGERFRGRHADLSSLGRTDDRRAERVRAATFDGGGQHQDLAL